MLLLILLALMSHESYLVSYWSWHQDDFRTFQVSCCIKHRQNCNLRFNINNENVFVLLFTQLVLMAGIDLVPNLSSCFQREGPGQRHGNSVSQMVENLCPSTARTKTSSFLIYSTTQQVHICIVTRILQEKGTVILFKIIA